MIKMVEVRRFVDRIQYPGDVRGHNYPGKIGYEEQQDGKNAHGNVDGLSEQKVTGRQLEYFAVGCLKGFENKPADNRQHQEIDDPK